MPKLTLTLEAVTPLFLAGADGGTPELRPASFRGALRFWLRALLGAHLGGNIKRLHEEESKIFGSTHGTSPVIVRTAAWDGSLKRERRRALPHSEWKQFAPLSFVEGSQFTLTLAARPAQQLPNEALAALLLMLNLGGVGKRSRRGFGSLQVVKAEPEKEEGLWEEQPANGEALVKHLRNVLKKAQSLVNISGVSPYTANALPDYPVFSEEHTLVLACEHAFTHSEHPYGQAMVDFWIKALRSSGLRDDLAYGHVIRGRRASPLILHLWRTKAGYHLVLTAFRSDPLPAGEPGWTKLKNLLKFCRVNWQGEYIFGKGGW